MMKKRILSVFVALALCLGLLPVTALAAENDRPYSLYVGNTDVAKTEYSDNAAYWTSSDGGANWTSQLDEPTADSYIHYDGNGTLTLHNVNISRSNENGIYAEAMSGSAVSLTIKLEGTNTVSGWSGIYVFSRLGDASLSISGTGSLTAEGTGGGSFSGIQVQSNDGKAELTINNVDVTATNNVAQGIILRSGGSSTASLTVNGGELTASGSDAGIKYVFGSSGTGDGTPTVTVSNNAIVRANGGISDDSSTDIQIGADSSASSGGIVFDGKNGTVYGDVTLQEDLEIGTDETLTIPEGASLDTNGKTITVESGGKLEGEPTGSGTVKIAPTITTKSLPGGTVGEPYTETILAATGDASITWSVSNGSLPAGLSLSKDGKITGTPTTEGTSTFTVTATNNIGSDSREFTLKIEKPAFIPVTDLELNKDSLTLQENSSDTLIATVKPDDATNRGVTWESSDTSIATVSEDGTVTAISAGNATITATAADGSGVSASCELTVTHGNMVHIPKKDATCTVDGNEEYWICENCGKYFGDANGDTEIAKDSWILNAIGHDWNDAVYTWSDDGSTCTATRTCKNDSAHTETSKATVTGAQTKAPTCTEKGETTYTATFEADWAMTQTKVLADISATGHGETERINAKDATCTQEGYTGDQVCKDCGAVLEQGHVTAKIAHNYKDGKCTVCGSADPTYNPNPQSPQTGDRHNVELWSSLLLVAAASFVLLTAVRRREREDA